MGHAQTLEVAGAMKLVGVEQTENDENHGVATFELRDSDLVTMVMQPHTMFAFWEIVNDFLEGTAWEADITTAEDMVNGNKIKVEVIRKRN